MKTSSPSKPLANIDALYWSFFVLLSWAVLIRLQSPSIAAGDSGETVTAAFLLGIPHPPGHPLAVLVDRLALALPVGTAAFRVNLLASSLVLLAALLLGGFCQKALAQWDRRWEGGRALVGGWLAFTWLLSSPMVVEAALTAKGTVYGLALLGSILLLRSVRWDEPAGGKEIFGLTFLLGTLFATHWPTAILLSTYAGVWFVDGRFRDFKRWAYGSVAFIFGLSVYLYLPLRAFAHSGMDWGHPVTWDSFTWVVTRAAYSEWSRTGDAYSSTWTVLVVLGRSILSSFPGALLGFWGLWVLRSRRAGGFYGFIILLMAATMGIAGFPRLEKGSLFLVNAYWIPFQGIWVYLALVGSSDLVGRRRVGTQWGLVLVAVLCLAGVPWWWPRVSHQDRARDLMPHDLGENLLQSLPRDSSVLLEGDTSIGSTWYARWVEGKRPDVLVVPAVFAGEAWGLAEILANQGRPIDGTPKFSSAGERLLWFIRQTAIEDKGPRRLVFANYVDGLVARSLLGTSLGLDPWGMMLEISSTPRGTGAARSSVWAAFSHASHRGMFPAWEAIRRAPGQRELFVLQANPFVRLGNIAQAQGKGLEASDDYARALLLLPDSPEVHTDLAASVVALGMPEMAEVLCRKAIALDPRFAPAWHNLGNVQELRGRWDEAVVAYDKALALMPGSEVTERNKAIALGMKRTTAPPRMEGHDAVWYRDQAGKFMSEGRKVLAGLAAETAEAVEKGRK